MDRRLWITTGLGCSALVAILALTQLPRLANASDFLWAPRVPPATVAPIALIPPPVVAVTTPALPPEPPLPPAAPIVVERPAPPAPPAPVAEPPPAPVRDPEPARDVDIVLCLDTSGSMEGLLDSTRARLWDIVSSVGKKEPNAHLRVALLTYGSPNASAEGGYITIQSDLTEDLDTVYAKAMRMTTDGGDEYVGWVMHRSLHELSWSKQKGAARILFVAGNESADQGREVHDFRTVAMDAKERGVIVNAIYAGNKDAGASEQWAQVAAAGGGQYTAIEQSAGFVQVATPYDAEIQRLNAELNGTYVPYGDNGRAGLENQLEQDNNAMRMGIQSSSARAATKASGMYKNESWDLIDGLEGGRVQLDTLSEEAMNEDMKQMTPEQRRAHVDEMRQKRADLKKKLAELGKQHDEYVQDNRGSDAPTLDDATEAILDAQL